jgi:hypothetical protein
MERFPDLQEEVRLQGMALRSASVAGRSDVRDKLAQAAARADQLAASRTRKRWVRLMVAAAALAGLLVIVANPGQQPGMVRYAEVNRFGMLYGPHSSGGAIQATLYHVPGQAVGILRIKDDFRIRAIPLRLEAGPDWSASDSRDDELRIASQDPDLRQTLCEAMASMGLPISDPLLAQKNRWKKEGQISPKSGLINSYPLVPGFLIEEDPTLDTANLSWVASEPESSVQSENQSETWRRPREGVVIPAE